MKSIWREHAKPIIARVLRETAGQDEKVIRKALTEAYPFGERAMHPYKIWLSEIKDQRKGKKRRKKPGEVNDPAQSSLF